MFVGLMSAITGSVHYYLWARLVRDTALPTAAFRALTALVVVLFVSVPTSFWLSRSLPPHHGRVLLYAAYTWMGLMFYLLVLLGVGDLGRGLYHLGVWVSGLFGHQAAAVDPPSGTATARLMALAVTALAVGLGGVGMVGAAGAPRVRELRVALPRFPQELGETVLVQLTDLHLGPTLRREFLEDVVRRTNLLHPDVIVITGDVADGTVTSLRDMVAPLGELRARWGVYFATGNHEYYAGVDAWCAEFRRLGIRTLRGERVTVGDGEHGFDLAGVDDLEARRFNGGARMDLGATLAGRDPSRALVLLAHQPRMVFEAQKYGVDLQLSGHTHGGQFWPWLHLVRLQQPVVSGLGRFGDTFVYASNGTGYWGPPMRLGVPAEITKVILTHADGSPRAERGPAR
jgi:hypothetical protein